MKIAIGTKNKGKLAAIERAINEYPMLFGAELVGLDVGSDVSDQPKSLPETITGAKNRARKAYESSGADLGFGLESGIFPVPEAKSDYMDTSVCAIYDGKNYHLGFSSCFEYPKELITKVIEEGKEITHAALECGFSNDENFHQGIGMIGILTKGRISRIDYSYQAVQTAMIHLENEAHY
jgi:inosine/xanthosine triphosphatase